MEIHKRSNHCIMQLHCFHACMGIHSYRYIECMDLCPSRPCIDLPKPQLGGHCSYAGKSNCISIVNIIYAQLFVCVYKLVM